MNANYRRGRRAEWKTKALLEAAGFTAARTAGSHGACDIIAWDAVSLRLIQVKVNSARVTPVEREALRLMARPANSIAEIWTFTPRVREPQIERVG